MARPTAMTSRPQATAASATARMRATFDAKVVTATLWGAARMSASGTCYGMRETSTNGTYYISGLATCTGDAASTDTGTLRSFT